MPTYDDTVLAVFRPTTLAAMIADLTDGLLQEDDELTYEFRENARQMLADLMGEATAEAMIEEAWNEL